MTSKDIEYWLIVIAVAAAIGTIAVTLTDRCTCTKTKSIEKIKSPPTYKVFYRGKEATGLT